MQQTVFIALLLFVYSSIIKFRANKIQHTLAKNFILVLRKLLKKSAKACEVKLITFGQAFGPLSRKGFNQLGRKNTENMLTFIRLERMHLIWKNQHSLAAFKAIKLVIHRDIHTAAAKHYNLKALMNMGRVGKIFILLDGDIFRRADMLKLIKHKITQKVK